MVEKYFAIGDIHGSFRHLENLFPTLPLDRERDTLVFLGDYINRGPQVREVIDFICALKKEGYRIVPLMGNHEYLLLEYAKSQSNSLLPYLRNLGLYSTLSAYGGASLRQLGDLSFLPREHREFLASLLPYFATDDYLFVHAGIKFGVALEDQTMANLCESRERFIYKKTGLDKKIIFGHTPFESPLVREDKVGIDTGAVYGNYLTALELPAFRFYHG